MCKMRQSFCPSVRESGWIFSDNITLQPSTPASRALRARVRRSARWRLEVATRRVLPIREAPLSFRMLMWWSKQIEKTLEIICHCTTRRRRNSREPQRDQQSECSSPLVSWRIRPFIHLSVSVARVLAKWRINWILRTDSLTWLCKENQDSISGLIWTSSFPLHRRDCNQPKIMTRREYQLCVLIIFLPFLDI